MDLQNTVPPLHCKNSKKECFNVENAVKSTRTPLMIVEPGYDSWQVEHSWLISSLNEKPNISWTSCVKSLQNCSEIQMSVLNLYNWILQEKIKNSCLSRNKCSYFISSCYVHGQFNYWPWRIVKINEKSIQKAVSDFVLYGDEIQLFDNIFGDNKSCL